MDKHVSFEENIELDERIVDLASESEDRGALGMATADEATFIRRISLQQMKVRADVVQCLRNTIRIIKFMITV
jgi:hypothetical protein